ncbi:PAS domain-containing protein (plasmid) [Cereibacter azotoformans]|uniref:PAS domain-containing sensor histidine kinase n=1 Tax=Cereibacter azotoformans TaxID=43057 RepID=UPI001EEB9FBF|nr:PAS domain-containing sensor histidine kinase [Cereibacter azotoformans]ULB12457.1 PAS domain-containing protein [Cereibacter azotoformans]
MDLDDLYRLLRVSHVQAQGIVDTIRDPLLVLASDLTVISANPAFYRTFATDRDSTIGLQLYELGNGQWAVDELRLLLEKVIPNSASVFDYEVTADFPDVGPRTMLVSAQRLIHPDNGQRVLLLTIVDATTRRRKEDEKNILIGELDHRIKNLLSVTQALARQTETAGRTAEEYRDAFLGRFAALARSLEVYSRERSAQLPDLVRAVMEPYLDGASRVLVADAPTVALVPGHAMSLGMILHELATNAGKYGALSVPAGRVNIDWEIGEDAEGMPRICLRWQEHGGPATSPPDSSGFGTRMIRFAAEFELGGSAELDYHPEGFRASVSFPRLRP